MKRDILQKFHTLYRKRRGIICLVMTFVLSVSLFAPVLASDTKDEKRVIRLGCYEMPEAYLKGVKEQNITGGYMYDYMQAVANVAGWEYEYVYGDYETLFNMLDKGEIDVMCDIPYTSYRNESLYYPDFPMGRHRYYLYASADNEDIISGNLASINGKKIAVNEKNSESQPLNSWLIDNKITSQFVLCKSAAEKLEALHSGEADLIFETDMAVGDTEKEVEHIAESDFYVAVSKKSKGVIDELNEALSLIDSYNPYFTTQLETKYKIQKVDSSEKVLSDEEKAWFSEHSEIRVGCQANMMPFSAVDSETGKTKGAVCEITERILRNIGYEDFPINYVFYTSIEEATTALLQGEVDVCFPAYSNYNLGEQHGLMMTDAALNCSMAMVYRRGNKDILMNQIASLQTPIEQYYLANTYLGSTIVYCESNQDCVNKIMLGSVDSAVAVTNTAIELGKLNSQLRYTILSESAPVGYVTAKGNNGLFVALNRGIHMLDYTEMDNVMMGQTSQEGSYSVSDFLKDNVALVVGLVILLLFSFVALLWSYIQLKKNAEIERNSAKMAAKIQDLSVITALAEDYDYVCMVNMMSGEVTRYQSKSTFDSAIEKRIDTLGSMEEWNRFLQDTVYPVDAHIAEEFYREVSSILKRYRKKVVKCTVRMLFTAKPEYYRIQMAYNPVNENALVIGLLNVDEQIRTNLEEGVRRQELSVIAGLGDDYDGVIYVSVDDRDAADDNSVQYRFSEEFAKRIPENMEDIKFGERLNQLYKYIVHPDDKERFKTATSRQVVLSSFKQGASYQVDFRAVTDSGIHNYQLKMVPNRNKRGEVVGMVAGLHNMDVSVGKKRDEQMYQQAILNNAYSYFKANISANTLLPPLIENESGTPVDHSAFYGDKLPTYDALVEDNANKHLDDEFKADYIAFMSTQNLIHNFSQGNLRPEYVCRYYSEFLDWHWRRYICYLSKDDITGDIYAMIVAYDVSEEMAQKEKEQEMQHQLEEALELADSANEAKTSFLFNMSHDIRTPMNAITGYTEMIKKHLDEKERVADYIEKIELSGKHLLKLVNDVLDMSRIEAGQVEIVNRHADLLDGVVETMCRELAEAKDITIKSVVKNVENRYCLCDSFHINQILMNIMSNAVKYTPRGGTIQFTIEQKKCDNPEYGQYEFTIEDNGIGMDEEFQSHIYETFSREKTATVSGIEGTGLGMAIVKKLTDLLDGTIHIASQKGKGTRVTLCLTLRLENSEEVATAKKEMAGKNWKFDNKRVLIVEDNEMNREITMEILKEKGFVVEEAEDGDDAVDIVKAAPPGHFDLILMDVQMPRMDGYQATRAIRELNYPGLTGIPIIALSANAFEEDRKKSLEAGMNDHVAKPIDINQLFSTIARYIPSE